MWAALDQRGLVVGVRVVRSTEQIAHRLVVILHRIIRISGVIIDIYFVAATRSFFLVVVAVLTAAAAVNNNALVALL